MNINSVKDLQSALLDLLDGDYRWWDIQNQTGLPEERCMEISAAAQLLSEKKYGVPTKE